MKFKTLSPGHGILFNRSSAMTNGIRDRLERLKDIYEAGREDAVRVAYEEQVVNKDDEDDDEDEDEDEVEEVDDDEDEDKRKQ